MQQGREALVLEQPGVAALDRPAALAKTRSTWLATLVDVGFSIERAAESPIGLGVIAFVGEDGADAGRDREGGQEQPLEDEGVVDVGGGGKTSDRDAGPVDRDMVLRAALGAVRRVGPGEVTAALGAYRAAIEDQVGMATQHADQQGVDLRQQAGLGPTRQAAAQRRAAGLRRARR